MIIVKNNIIPFKGFAALTMWPFVFIRKNIRVTDKLLNHEKIHIRQQIECLFIFFWIIYGIEYLISIFKRWNNDASYYTISFEEEAYANEKDLDYLNHRKPWAWIKYLGHI